MKTHFSLNVCKLYRKLLWHFTVNWTVFQCPGLKCTDMSLFSSCLEDWPVCLLTVLYTSLSRFNCLPPPPKKNWKSAEICHITGITFRAYFHLLGFVRMKEAYTVNVSSEHFLFYQNLSFYQHFTCNIRKTKGRKAVLI